MDYLRALHYLYHVFRFGGIAQAVKKMPYGVQQPALSQALLNLECLLGKVLFQRHPFRPTPAGQHLYEVIQPFFDRLPLEMDAVRGDAPGFLRIAAYQTVLHDYLLPLLRALEAQFPGLRFSLHDGNQAEVVRALQEQEIDLGVTMREGKPPPGCVSESLLTLPLVLLVPSRSRWRSATELWRDRQVNASLVCPGEEDVLTRFFRRGLRKQGVQWPIGIELTSYGSIEQCAREGVGIGLSVCIPGRRRKAGVRELALPGFPPLDLAMFWQQKPSPVTRVLMNELRRLAARMKQAAATVSPAARS